MRSFLAVLLMAACGAGCGFTWGRHDYEHYFPEPQSPPKDVQADFDTQIVAAPLSGWGWGGTGPYVPSAEELWRKGPYHYFNRLRIASNLRGLDARQGGEDSVIGARNKKKLTVLYGKEYEAIRRAKRVGKAEEAKEAEEAEKGKDYHRYIGLALSGGGIRSASFATGVLQGLYELGVLEDVGYLSTVSGGGYAGSWYMTHVDRRGHPSSPEDLLARGSAHLQHLSQFGNYLASSHSSSAAGEFFSTTVPHGFTLPFHWTANWLVDLDVNTGFFRGAYRKGLARCFLYDRPFSWTEPDRVSQEKPREKYLHELGPTTHRPFWVVNMHLELHDDRQACKNRSGDAFEVTPLWAGGDAVGYIKTTPNGGKPTDLSADLWWTRVPYAVSMSAAAVDSQSLKQSGAASLALAALDLDLAYFVPGFNHAFNKDNAKGATAVFTHHAVAPLWLHSLGGAIRRRTSDKDENPSAWHDRTVWSKRCRLSDGGHFENLGVYALVRRGCRLIIVSDAGCDPLASEWDQLDNDSRARAFTDIHLLEEKLEADFGARLDVDWKSYAVGGSPSDGAFGHVSGKTVFIGTVRGLPIGENYLEDVTLVFIKAAYSYEGQLLDHYGFIDAMKAERPEWPHDPTYKQFYNERRVLAYRTLGREMVLRAGGAVAGDAKSNLIVDKVEELKYRLAKSRKRQATQAIPQAFAP
ncbi:hypothetical protein HQ560_11585 [bacterium]|nr:hypothetical protein [bacterium]